MRIFAKFPNFTTIWKQTVFFCYQHDHLILINPFFHVVMSVHFRFKIILPVEIKTSIFLDLTNQLQWNIIFTVIGAIINVSSQNMTSYNTDDVTWGNIDNLTCNAKTGVNIYTEFYQNFSFFFTSIPIKAV